MSAGGALVRADGELWHVESEQNLTKGELVRVTGLDGVTLKVEKVKGEN